MFICLNLNGVGEVQGMNLSLCFDPSPAHCVFVCENFQKVTVKAEFFFFSKYGQNETSNHNLKYLPQNFEVYDTLHFKPNIRKRQQRAIFFSISKALDQNSSDIKTI